MARPPRLLIENGLYHITARGNRKASIYEDDRDCRVFLAIVGQGMLRCQAHAHAYCLMGNHYHLLVQTPNANLSKLMHYINGTYTQYSNRQHQRCGHVFQGRYHSVLVDCDAYFMQACRYVDLNPVRAGLVTNVATWAWSSYRAHAGLQQGPDWLCSRLLHECMAPHAPATDGPQRYRTFVDQGLEMPDAGISSFAATHAPAATPEKVRLAQAVSSARLSLQSYLHQGHSRNAAIYATFSQGGHSMGVIARAMQLSLSIVSRVIKEQSDITSPLE